MKRRFPLLAAVLTIGVVGLAPSPASGGGDFVEAQSAALGPTADCSNDFNPLIGVFADLQDPWSQFGDVTTLDGETVGGFPEQNDLPGPTVFADGAVTPFGQGVLAPQAEGTVLGTYGWVSPGNDPTLGGAEWFVLYRCSDVSPGTGELYTCFGPFGTCPATAFEAQALLFEAVVDDDTPDPGQTIEVTGLDCFGDDGSIALEDAGGTVVDSVDGLVITDDVFSGALTVPADASPGAEWLAVATCNAGGSVRVGIPLVIAGEAPTSTVAPVVPAPPVAAVAVAAEPRFTG